MGKILALTWRAVDQPRRIVTVFQSKNGERRALPLNQTVLNVLKERAKVRSLRTDLVSEPGSDPAGWQSPAAGLPAGIKEGEEPRFSLSRSEAYLRDPAHPGWRRTL